MPLYMILPIAVTWITLDQHSISLKTAWQTEQLTYTILPAWAEENNVTWSTSNPSIATVSSTWLVTCVTPGECVITVTTIDWWFTDTCNVVKTSEIWYSSQAFEEYKNCAAAIGSVCILDTWCRFRFTYPVYIWNRTIIDFGWWCFRKINADTLTVTSYKTMCNPGNSWYFGDNRILTRCWILDFDWNVITSFCYQSITPWDTWVVWANCWYDIYKWIVDWDNITFSCIWTSQTDQSSWWMNYWPCWAYLLNGSDNSWSWYSSYINPTTNAITAFWWQSHSRQTRWWSMPDWKLYRFAQRCNCRWRLQRIWTWDEWLVWNWLSNSWLDYWQRSGKFLGNSISWWMNTNNWTWNWYWSNNYYIDEAWTVSIVQSNTLSYDTWVQLEYWAVDEKWWIYPNTYWWGSGVVLKTDKTFTDFNWKNPYMRR